MSKQKPLNGSTEVGVIEKEITTSADQSCNLSDYHEVEEDLYCFEGSTVYEDKNSFIVKLIEKIRLNPCLYNHNSPDWRNVDVKREIWDKIGRELQVENASFLEKEFKKLKDNYRKCMKRRKSDKKAGKSTPMCNFFKELSFLREHMSSFDGMFTVTPDELSESNMSPSFLARDTSHQISYDHDKASRQLAILSKSDTVTTLPVVTKPPSRNMTQNIISTPAVPEKKLRLSPSVNNTELYNNTTAVNNSNKQQYVSFRVDAPKDTHQLFCESLVEPLRNLSAKKSKLAKAKIMQVLYELEDD